MAELAELEVNLLQFVLKSFGFERIVSWDGREFAIFERTETESESKFRPKLLKLRVLVPRDWVLYDLAAEVLLIGREGKKAGPQSAGTAIEAAAEKSEFREQGIDWRRVNLPGWGFVYVPIEFADSLLSGIGLERLKIELSKPRGS